MRVIFMGTPDFAVPALNALVEAGHEIVAVYTQPPRRAGRGKALRPTPVQTRAEVIGLPIRYPASLKSPETQRAFMDLQADIAVVVAYGLLLPSVILNAPVHGCLNIHASLLPRWRGAAPIHRAIMAGDLETGVCIMQMEAGLDTGPVLLREAVQIGETETTGMLQNSLGALGARLVVETLRRRETLSACPQAQDGVTYAAKINKAEAAIDWGRSAHEVTRHINGLSPFPGAFVVRNGQRLKLLQARAVAGEGVPGMVLSALKIACAQGAVEILRVQPAGRDAMKAHAWVNGAGDLVGQKFEDE